MLRSLLGCLRHASRAALPTGPCLTQEATSRGVEMADACEHSLAERAYLGAKLAARPSRSPSPLPRGSIDLSRSKGLFGRFVHECQTHRTLESAVSDPEESRIKNQESKQQSRPRRSTALNFVFYIAQSSVRRCQSSVDGRDPRE